MTDRGAEAVRWAASAAPAGLRRGLVEWARMAVQPTPPKSVAPLWVALVLGFTVVLAAAILLLLTGGLSRPPGGPSAVATLSLGGLVSLVLSAPDLDAS